MDTSKLSGWSILRAVMPPWKDLQDPLVQYDIHLHRRAGRRPWGAILLGWGTLILLNLYLLSELLGSDIGGWIDDSGTSDFDNLLVNSLGYLVVGLVLISMVGHWRLLMAVSARAAAIIAARRGRGDWDLIAITPVEKSRWLRAQLVTIGWQVFPIVRLLLVVQLVLVLICFGQLTRIQYEERQQEQAYEEPCRAEGGCYWDEQDYLPTGLYVLATLPFDVMIVLEPLVTTGIFAAVSLYLSSRSQRTTMSLLYSFLSIYLVRVFLALVFLVGGMLIFMAVMGLATAVGLVGSDWDWEWDGIGEFFGLFCVWLCFAVLILAFFLEWMPMFAPMILLLQLRTGEHITRYVILILTFLLAYFLAPLWVIRSVGGRTVDRLNRRES